MQLCQNINSPYNLSYFPFNVSFENLAVDQDNISKSIIFFDHTWRFRVKVRERIPKLETWNLTSMVIDGVKIF